MGSWGQMEGLRRDGGHREMGCGGCGTGNAGGVGMGAVRCWALGQGCGAGDGWKQPEKDGGRGAKRGVLGWDVGNLEGTGRQGRDGGTGGTRGREEGPKGLSGARQGAGPLETGTGWERCGQGAQRAELTCDGEAQRRAAGRADAVAGRAVIAVVVLQLRRLQLVERPRAQRSRAVLPVPGEGERPGAHGHRTAQQHAVTQQNLSIGGIGAQGNPGHGNPWGGDGGEGRLVWVVWGGMGWDGGDGIRRDRGGGEQKRGHGEEQGTRAGMGTWGWMEGPRRDTGCGNDGGRGVQ